MKSVAVIGQGLWGKKIVNSLQNHFNDYEVEGLSSRNFLCNPPEKVYDVLWVAVQPSNQLKIVEIALSNSRRIILEKPIGATLKDFSQIEKILMSADTIFELSRPWCFSNIWISAKEKIKSWDLHDSLVTFKRSGPLAHQYIPSIEDWLPHDVYLASDLFPSFENDFSIDFCSKTSNKIHLSMNSQAGAILNFSFTESTTKESIIEIRSASGRLLVNLIQKKLEFDGQKCDIIIPNSYDEISRNFNAVLHSDNKRIIQLVHTQKWIKSLIDQTV